MADMILFIGNCGEQPFYLSEPFRRAGFGTLLVSSSAPDLRRPYYLRWEKQPLGFRNSIRRSLRLLRAIRKANKIFLFCDPALSVLSPRIRNIASRLIFKRSKELCLVIDKEFSEKAALWLSAPENRRRREQIKGIIALDHYAEESLRGRTDLKVQKTGRAIDTSGWPFLVSPSSLGYRRKSILVVGPESGRRAVIQGIAMADPEGTIFSVRESDGNWKGMRNRLKQTDIVIDLTSSGTPSDAALRVLSSGRLLIADIDPRHYDFLNEIPYLITGADFIHPTDEQTALYGPVLSLPSAGEELAGLLERVLDSELLPQMMYDSRILAENHHDAETAAELLRRSLNIPLPEVSRAGR